MTMAYLEVDFKTQNTMRISGVGSFFILLGILVASLLTSCTTNMKKTNRNNIDRAFEVEDFNRIVFEGTYSIELTQGNETSFSMSTTDELQNKVEVWVSNEVLNVKSNIKNIGSDEIKIYITFQQLSDVKVRGGAFLKTNGFVELNDFNIEIEGGASVNMQVNANKLKAKAAGAVNMQFEGVTDEFNAISEGAGNIDADELKAKMVECRVSGVGNASVYATEVLHAKVEGLGKISYRGNPTLYKKVDGIGVIYRK